jgi:hypothetical protein
MVGKHSSQKFDCHEESSDQRNHHDGDERIRHLFLIPPYLFMLLEDESAAFD